MKRILLWLFLASFAALSVAADTLKQFQADSLEEITANRKGRPFILIAWSVDCTPCLKELGYLQQLRNKFSQQDLVLLATDGPAYSEVVSQTLDSFNLQTLANWNYAASSPEQLRYHIDPEWFGELPHAWFYDANHHRKAHSGVLGKVVLEQWLAGK